MTTPPKEPKTVDDIAEDELRVKKIESGTVLDHLPGGSSMRVLEILGIGEGFTGTASVLVNTPSSRYGLKDILKIEGRNLTRKELDRIALIAPYATANIIRNYKVVEKFRLRAPDVITGVVACPNGKCVTNVEGTPSFTVEERDPLKVRCHYCEMLYHYKDLSGIGEKEGALGKWIRT